jgi:hypothetical protein
MRRSIAFSAALLVASVGIVAAQGPTPPAQQGEQRPPLQKDNPLPGSPEHQRQVDDALNSKSGRAGKAEPLPEPASDDRVFVNGVLNLTDAPKDLQTEPAKFSAHNAALDKLPITAARFTDEERRRIAAALNTGPTAVAHLDTTVAQELAPGIDLLDLPDALKRKVPSVNALKYVRTNDRLLLVDPRSRIVVGEIAS